MQVSHAIFLLRFGTIILCSLYSTGTHDDGINVYSDHIEDDASNKSFSGDKVILRVPYIINLTRDDVEREAGEQDPKRVGAGVCTKFSVGSATQSTTYYVQRLVGRFYSPQRTQAKHSRTRSIIASCRCLFELQLTRTRVLSATGIITQISIL